MGDRSGGKEGGDGATGSGSFEFLDVDEGRDGRARGDDQQVTRRSRHRSNPSQALEDMLTEVALDEPQLSQPSTVPLQPPPSSDVHSEPTVHAEEKYAAELQQLYAIFPNKPQSQLLTTIEAHSGNVERAAEFLLSDAAAGDTDAGDARLADRAEDDDATFARRLQTQLYREPAPLGHRSPKLRSRRPAPPSEAVSSGLRRLYRSQLTPEHFREGFHDDHIDKVNANVRDMLVPMLQQQIANLRFPPLRSDSQRLSYSVDDVRVSDVHIPAARASVQLTAEWLVVTLDDIRVELDIGEWRYDRIAVPTLKDAGSAHATLEKVKCVVRLREGSDAHSDPLRVNACMVTVGALTLKATESKAAWLYNIFAMALKPLLKSTAEDSLEEAVSRAVEAQTSDLIRWMTED